MREKINQNSFSGQSIYVGIDVHLKEWKVTVMGENIHYQTLSSPPEAAALGKYLFGISLERLFMSANDSVFTSSDTIGLTSACHFHRGKSGGHPHH